jgi:hypothetical protein
LRILRERNSWVFDEQTEQQRKRQRKRRVLPKREEVQDIPGPYVYAFSRIAQQYEKRCLQQCRDPLDVPNCYKAAIDFFESAVRAICTDLPEPKPQTPEKAAEWDKAYGDAYTKQQYYLDNVCKTQPDAAASLREWFAPGVVNPFWKTMPVYSRQFVADFIIEYYGKLMRQRGEDGAGEAYRRQFHPGEDEAGEPYRKAARDRAEENASLLQYSQEVGTGMHDCGEASSSSS